MTALLFVLQLSDFGLAILGPVDSTEMPESEDVVGTFGYIAPEYFMHGRISDKIDIYSFGVVLLELVSGRRPILAEGESLVKWVRSTRFPLHGFSVFMLNLLQMETEQKYPFTYSGKINTGERGTKCLGGSRLGWKI